MAAEFAEALRDSPYPQAEDLARLMTEADTLAEEFPIDWGSELNPSDVVIPELADLIRSAAFLMHTEKSSPTGWRDLSSDAGFLGRFSRRSGR